VVPTVYKYIVSTTEHPFSRLCVLKAEYKYFPFSTQSPDIVFGLGGLA
jgi:hypothetical protein